MWGFYSYMNGERDALECVKCGLNWYQKHPTDWR